MHRSAVLGLVLLWPLSAAAQTTPASSHIVAEYTVYAAGLPTARVDAELMFAPSSYRLRLDYRTKGLFGAFVHVASRSLAQGLWAGAGVAPFHFAASARVGGELRQTVIDYVAGAPLIRELRPTNAEDGREPVPPALERNTIDTLSAIALLLRRVQESGSCEARAETFDGRRLLVLAAHTAGTQSLPRTARSPFFGPVLRCDFEGWQIAGFRHGERADGARPKHGSAWLAPVVAGAPPIPVRLSFETRWFGMATAYLTAAAGSAPAFIARAAPRPRP